MHPALAFSSSLAINIKPRDNDNFRFITMCKNATLSV